jgi:hypothetical protein
VIDESLVKLAFDRHNFSTEGAAPLLLAAL